MSSLLRGSARRLLPAAAAATVLLASSASTALGHASFLESQPPPGARLAASPEAITLEFSEPLNPRLTAVSLTEPGGDGHLATRLDVADRRLTLRARQRLKQGTYVITWRSVSTVDGHVREGSLSFGVGAPASPELELEQSPLTRDGWLRVGSRAALYLALFLFVGGLAGAVLLRGDHPADWLAPSTTAPALKRAGLDRAQVAERAWRRTQRAGWTAAGLAAAVAVIGAADAAGGLRPSGLSAFLFTNPGGLARVATVVFLLVAAAVARRSPPAAAALGAAGLWSIAVGGHASSADPPAAAVASDFVHLLAGAAWVGGMGQITWAWAPLVRRGAEVRMSAVRSVLPRFGRLALPAFLVVAGSGLVTAVIQLGSVSALWTTGYGRVLTVKIALVAALALASYGHAFRLRPRLAVPGPRRDGKAERLHWRLLRAEPAIAVVVLAAAALLVTFPLPPAQLDGRAQAGVPPCDPCPFAKPNPGELAVAARAGPYTTAVWLRREAGQLRGTLRVLDGKRRPAALPTRVAGGGEQRPCGRGCWRFTLAGRPRAIRVALNGPRGAWQVGLPAGWAPDGDRRAVRILARSQRVMRALRTVRQRETVVSAPRPGLTVAPIANTAEFRFQAPDRMAYTTSAVESVAVGSRQWVRPRGLPWQQLPGDGTQPYLAANRFAWMVFASSARLIEIGRQAGRPVARLAFLDHGYPVWYELTVDLRSGHALAARLLTPGNAITDRWYGFDEPLRIAPPGRSGTR